MLRFKKEGWFLEEDSARYTAPITVNLFVRVFKCSYSKKWKVSFVTKSGYRLDHLTSDYLSTMHDGSKKNVIEQLNEDAKWLSSYDNKAAELELSMREYEMSR